MSDRNTIIKQIDAVLPQTQCGLCDYNGCKPYAEAIVNTNERIDKCLPGGVTVLKQLGELTNQNPAPYVAEMQGKCKPDQIVRIREDECIGCTKCIQACPTDAILGAAKLMHSVIENACTGCELCIEPCPMDCIDIIELPARSSEEKQHNATQWRQRYEWRNQRHKQDQIERQQKHQAAKLNTSKNDTLVARKAAIADAVARAKAKKSSE